MKTILFLDGSKFKTHCVKNFIESNFSKSEVDFISVSSLSALPSLKTSSIDMIIIGDNIDVSIISKQPQSYYTPSFICTYITTVLNCSPKCCLFTNIYDYTSFDDSEDNLYNACKANNISYINNLDEDAFSSLFDFINQN